MGLQQNNLNKEECQEESEDAEDNPLNHCHSHSTAYESRKIEQCQAKRKLYAASIICLIFMIAEIIEILGALMSMLIIWVVTGVLTYLASMRLLHPDFEIEATVMLITSGCAVIANVILSLTLHQTGPGHSHRAQANEHIPALQQKPALANASVRAAFVHAIGDLVQSISVLISALIIFFKPEYQIADPVCTFVFSIFVLATTITILRDILLVLMEGTPKGFNYDAVRERILAVNKVESIHNLHLWSLTMNQVILSAHVVTEDTVDNHQILKEVTQVLFDTYTFHSVTIQIELQANQKPDCVFCQDPKD
ncbi:unnamed protein product [Caretta caretta]